MTMKTKMYMWVLALLLAGCNDFLEESSQDEMRPSTVEDMEQLLLGDGYEDANNIYYLTDIFTDDMNNNPAELAGLVDNDKWKFTWNEQMFNKAGGGENISLWQVPYENILGCNLVLDYLDKVEGNSRLRENLRGEALTLRAWYHLHLVNFFGVAYNQGNPVSEPGVPLKLSMDVEGGKYFTRNTVGEVYAQIEKDLLEGNHLLTTYDQDRNFYRIGHLAAKAMLSRVYLYMEEWDKALAYADSVLAEKPALLDLNKVSDVYDWSTMISGTILGVYNVTTPDEIIWVRRLSGGRPISYFVRPFYSYDGLDALYGWSIDDWLARKPLKGDFRGIFHFGYLNSGSCRDAVTKSLVDLGVSSCWQGIRTAELYLNRAEVYARKYLEEGNDAYRTAALADLNRLRSHRFNEDYYVPVNISDGRELLEFCFTERRRELVGETNHRWCDVRRQGITVTHVMVDEGNVRYVQDMTRYALPIPEEILRRNPILTQN